MHPIRTALMLSALAAAARGAPSAIQFTQVTTNSANPRPSKTEVLLQGDKFSARSADDESQFPPPGSYILGTGGGNIYIVYPAQRSYAKFDQDEIKKMGQQAAARQPGRRSHLMNEPREKTAQADSNYSHAIENFKFEKELDEAGPTMFGHPTRHYRYHLSYEDVTHAKPNPKPIVNKVDEVDEFWSTDAFGTIADILKRVGFKTPESKGGDYDQVEKARMTMMHHGLMLKSVTTHKDSQSLPMGAFMNALAKMSRGGRGNTRVTTEEITALSEAHPTRDAFALPRDFQETDMMSLFTASAGGMPDLSGASRGSTKSPTAMPDLNSTGE